MSVAPHLMSCQHSTRKIYMLAGTEPAPELTGGPWYTDKELDMEFIKLLMNVCLKIVRDRVRCCTYAVRDWLKHTY